MNPSIKKIVHFPVTKIIIGIAFCFSLFVVVQNFISKPLLYSIFPDKNISDPIIHTISVFVLLFSYYFLFRFYDKREVTELSPKNFTKNMLGSILLGFGAISLTILILYLSGYYQILSVSTEYYSLRLFGMLVMAALIEDLFHRALIARILENWLGTNIAIIIIMLLETMHMFNPNANLFSLFVDLVWGFTMTVLFVYSKKLWLPLFFHLGWNFAQLFYGSSLTGLNDMGRIITAKFGGPEIFNGGAVGVENSIFTVTTLLGIGIYFYYRAKKEGKIVPGRKFRTETTQTA
ncbi:CPBP family intramembrane metalloprotease [Flavobacterium amniphilum]|uniref:CPBP family intramembrane glutamic endopeptidase n=1 Tax=Flavobacterium amniphilum TaxID=1834035 RepID=UPI00202A0012|nr:CPBP family intramembrane glutamic endopeptidase [Flavobacterium amniphilum]MCL9804205.1 CPBP family intramembrane metalloprotease [Flavobacterium amniphilum]